METRIFLDSGAPSLYNRFARKKENTATYMGSFLKDRKHDTYDWLEEPEYLEYRDAYVEYIRELGPRVTTYANLDIVNNPKATYENQKWFEAQGLRPMPVWHFGSDVKWLLRYIKEGYDYIGIGGLVPNPYCVLKPALDEIFTKYLTDRKGYPVVKLHGFAATSIQLMTRYPWYSVDSASWIKYGNYGWVLLPQRIRGNWRYSEMSYKINVSGKSPTQNIKERHYQTLSPQKRRLFDAYMEEHGFVMGKSEFYTDERGRLREVIVEPGLCNRPHLRSQINACFYLGLEKQLPKWPWPFKSAKIALL